MKNYFLLQLNFILHNCPQNLQLDVFVSIFFLGISNRNSIYSFWNLQLSFVLMSIVVRIYSISALIFRFGKKITIFTLGIQAYSISLILQLLSDNQIHLYRSLVHRIDETAIIDSFDRLNPFETSWMLLYLLLSLRCSSSQ